jgi:hypothetical protein
MPIELPRELETQIRDTAQAQGISVAEYLETLVTETNVRRKQVSEFRAAIAERMASLNADDHVDGEEVMARLLAGLTPR